MSPKKKNLKIVGIGASASGLQALEAFFSSCPSDSGLSFVVVQHLSPDFKSMHSSLLARKTEMPVSVAEEATVIEPNHIYLIPGKKNIVLREDKLQLLNRAPAHEINLPIDIFFSSLAKEKKEEAVGIILSGTGSDGTRGAAAIKEAGGTVFVQNPEESGFTGMPLSVIQSGLADFVLNAGQIPAELASYFDYSNKKEKKGEARLIDRILEIIKSETKYDFTAYRKQTLSRRIVKRKNINKLEKLADYLAFLENNEKEQNILVNEFMIGVTRFFRDKGYFQTLNEKAIPNIIALKGKGETIKLWAIGCVTGEEAYSLAILVKEGLKANEKNLDFKIFATDINIKAIEKASKGYFGLNIAADIEPQHLSKYFKREDKGFVVLPHLRKHVVFSIHDILYNPPFNKMDLISCRNLLIYFQDSAKEKTIKSILYALNVNGYLFLGSSESLGAFSRYFEVVDNRAKIFLKKMEYDSGSNAQDLFSTRIERLPAKKVPELTSELAVQFAKKLALVTHSVCICINESLQVLEVYGSLRLIGSLPDEGFSTNLLKLLPKEFHIAIATAIRTLSKSSDEAETVSKAIKFTSHGKSHSARIIFSRFDQLAYPHEKFFLLAINVEALPLSHLAPPATDAQTASNIEIQELQNLLEDTRESLQLTIEELESSNEEAQATNEELVSSNEELQSTNEELQSVNEELYTVNAELQEKNIQLLELNSDIENLINSSPTASLFLDGRLHIRRFTPSLRNIIDLWPSDLGRSITNFSLPDEHFLTDIQSVAGHHKPHRKKIITTKGKWYLQEIHSYVSPDENHNNRGVVINYTDITDLNQASSEIEEKTKFLKDILRLFPGNFFIYDLEEQRAVFFNPSFGELLDYTPEEINEMGDKIIANLFSADDALTIHAHHQKMRKAKKDEIYTLQANWITKNKEAKRMESTDRPFEINADGTVKSILSFLRVLENLK